jgi:hypothetical protein
VSLLSAKQLDDLELGQSGDSVRIELLGEQLVVRKESPVNHSRLEKQYLKQLNFDHSLDFKIPKVIVPWDGTSFSMEYVSGTPLGKFLGNASISEVESLTAIVSAYIKSLITSSALEPETINKNVSFNSKLTSMSKVLSSSEYELVHSALFTLNKESIHIRQLIGPNHGDFSFENILINQNSGEAWILDFLDSPIETPLLDISRILMDLENGWWGSGLYPSASERLSSTLMAEVLRATCYENGVSSFEISYFKLFTALRLVPYTVKPLRMSILIELIAKELVHLSKGPQ